MKKRMIATTLIAAMVLPTTAFAATPQDGIVLPEVAPTVMEAPAALKAAPVVNTLAPANYGTYLVTLTAPEGGMQDDVKAFLNNLESVTVNGKELKKSSDFMGIAKEGEYYINAMYGDFKFNKADIGNGSGVYNFVLSATGYENVTFTVVDGALGTAPQILPAPVLTGMLHKDATLFAPGNYIFEFDQPEGIEDKQYFYDFLAGLTEVKVNDTVLAPQSENFGLKDNEYKLFPYTRELHIADAALGNGEGAFTVTVTSEGFDTLTFYVVDGELADSATLKAAPVLTGSNHKEGTLLSAGEIEFNFEAPKGTENNNDYFFDFLNNLEVVAVDGKALALQSEHFGLKANEYNFHASTRLLRVAEAALGNGKGEFTVTLKAKGFEKVTIQVVDGVAVIPEIGLEAPKADHMTYNKGTFLMGGQYNLFFTVPEDPEDMYFYNFIDSVTEVAVDGQVLSPKSGHMGLKDNEYNFYGYSKELQIAEAALGFGKGTHTVTVKAEGYKTLTVVVTDGELVLN